MRGRGIKKVLIFGLSNWVDGSVIAETEKILGGGAGMGGTGREVIDSQILIGIYFHR